MQQQWERESKMQLLLEENDNTPSEGDDNTPSGGDNNNKRGVDAKVEELIQQWKSQLLVKEEDPDQPVEDEHDPTINGGGRRNYNNWWRRRKKTTQRPVEAEDEGDTRSRGGDDYINKGVDDHSEVGKSTTQHGGVNATHKYLTHQLVRHGFNFKGQMQVRQRVGLFPN